MTEHEDRSDRRRKIPGPLTARRVVNIAEHYIASRECSVAMLRNVLERRLARRLATLDGPNRERERLASEEAIAAELDRRVASGHVDDRRFAEMKARSARASGQGTRRILIDLERKGIAPDLARLALEAADRESSGVGLQEADPVEIAVNADWLAAEELARKKRIGPFRDHPAPTEPRARAKLWTREAGLMARRGFGYDVIREILGREPEEETD